MTTGIRLPQLAAPYSERLQLLRRCGPLATDVILLGALAWVVQAVRFDGSGGAVDIGIDVVNYQVFSVLIVAAWSSAVLLATPKTSAWGSPLPEQLRGVMRGSAGTFLAAAVLALLLKSDFSRFFLLIVFPLGVVVLVLSRLGWSAWSRVARERGGLQTSIVVVGQGDDPQSLAAELGRDGTPGMRVVAVVADQTAESVVEIVRAHRAALVVVCTGGGRERAFLQDLAWALEGTGAQVAVSTRVGMISSRRFSIQAIGAHPFVVLDYPQLSRAKQLVKRSFDIVVAGCGLVVLSPALALIALAVTIDSRGPVLFTQTRVGERGTSFRMLKFRSMVVDADRMVDELADANEGAGPLFKLKNDPRVTRVGSRLRRWSLDELPQLVNVVRGDMSLVGPRPALPREVAVYPEGAHRRLHTRPGLTGLWQISGRSDLPWEEGLRLDLSYVENWSVTGDIVILLRTLSAVLAKRGAY